MREVDEIHVWIGIGLVGSLLLGIALMPLRSVTSASNLAFVFLAFTIVVAELGGRAAALAAAVASALSLDFFLTEPYFRFTIEKPSDIVAFLSLAGCGLIAAAFGKRRGRWTEIARSAGDDLDLVRVLVWQLRAGAPLDETLDMLRQSFRLRAMTLRDPDGRILAAAHPGVPTLPIPTTELDPDRLVAFGNREGRIPIGSKGLRLPITGGRLRLRGDAGGVALDLWAADGGELEAHEIRALSIAASVLALEFSHRRAA